MRELDVLIRELGGLPLHLPHLPTGVFKVAVQALGATGAGDRAVLLAFKANELQSREKYARCAAAAGLPEAAAMLARAAEDEARHYAWAEAEFAELGAGAGTPLGAMGDAFAAFHTFAADLVEGIGRAGLDAAIRALPRIPGRGA